ncbi:MAG: efflux RND transporter periplasmic adaptor subunit [Proteobacteria bacterium]|nr:efflux RND transporter periplasmic adaptor subunit [Pseudomonadota bacterium]
MKPNTEGPSFFKTVMKAIVPLALIAAGGAAWAYFQATAPRMKRKPPETRAVVVDVVTVRAGDARAVVKAMGTVIPSRQVTLRARASGTVLSLSSSFVPGGRVVKDEEIMKLDPSDYDIQVRKAAASLEKAQADLDLERGNQTIAREELRLLSKTSKNALKATDLSMRKPQLKQARAAVSSAEADLRGARLNLARTVVRAPFNALVVERMVNLGSYVNSQDSLATLVGTDEYWIEALVPLDRLTALNLNHDGGRQAVVLSQNGSGRWSGRAVRATGQLNEKSRMATVIIEVPDPLGQTPEDSPPLMLGDYVFVEVAGRELTSVIELPRAALRDGDTVWVERDGVLDVREVELAWKQGERVFIAKGLESGDRIVVSDLSTPVKGMRLDVSDPGRETARTGSGQDRP